MNKLETRIEEIKSREELISIFDMAGGHLSVRSIVEMEILNLIQTAD